MPLSENNIIFAPDALREYETFAKTSVATLRKINRLLDDIIAHPFYGIGKPEALKYELSGCWSRRINHGHRLVYRVAGDTLHIISCRFHYVP